MQFSRIRVGLVAALGIACGRPTSMPSPAAAGASTPLRPFIDSMVDGPDFQNTNYGILIVDPERGDTLYARNAGKLFMPASNMKILTSATVLAQLGPDYRYRTTFAARGRVADGTLNGDLVVVGRGDPSVSDHMLGDAMRPLRAIADSIAARGIRRVTGHVIAGGDAFPGKVFGFGWTYDDFEDDYSAPIDELLFNEGFSDVHVRGADKVGEAPRVTILPAHTVPRVRVTATTVAAPRDSIAARGIHLAVRKDSTTWDVVLSGTIAVGDTTTIQVTQHNPDDAYVAALREALRDRGIAVDESPADTTAALDTLATLSSPPLRDILRALMKPSQNQIAEMLFRTAALERTGVGSSDSARAVVQRQIAQWGVLPSEAVVRDGSGLSRYDYITPRTVVRILDAMRRSPHFDAFYDALPIGGVDGTIRNRMKGTPAENNVHAKTGSVSQARSLSGYVTTADNHMLIFSILVNNFTTPTRSVERVQDAIVARLAGMRLR